MMKEYYIGSVYFTAKMLAATDRLELFVPPVEHLVSWHDIILRSVCHVLLVAVILHV